MKESADLARKALNGGDGYPTDDQIIDMLTNLRHLCDVDGLDFEALDETAYKHYTREPRSQKS